MIAVHKNLQFSYTASIMVLFSIVLQAARRVLPRVWAWGAQYWCSATSMLELGLEARTEKLHAFELLGRG